MVTKINEQKLLNLKRPTTKSVALNFDFNKDPYQLMKERISRS